MSGVSRGSLRRALFAAASCAAFSLIAAPALAQANVQQDVVIEAQPLAEALNALGAQYGATIFAADEITQGKTASALSGRLTLEEALRRLLSGTGLIARPTSGGAYVVVRPGKTAADPGAIVVSGQKVLRTLQETTDSVAVLTGETIDDSYITDISEALIRIPNVSTSFEGQGVSIRGIPERGVGSGTGDTSQTIAIYIDGAVQAQSGASNGILSTWDVAQIEVYRGPQTTTQGRAGIAGAVIVETVDPSFEWNGRARAAYGEFNTYQLAGALGGPIIPDLLAFRVAADVNRTDGFTTFVSDSAEIDDVGRNNRDLARAKLLFTPAPNFEAIASYTYSDARLGSNRVDVPDSFERVTRQTVSLTETQVHSASLRLNIGLSYALSLTSVSAYTDLEGQTSPQAETLGIGTITNIDFSDSAFTQEIRLNYDDGGNVRGIAGIYYADIEEFNLRDLIVPIPPVTTLSAMTGFDNTFENFAIFGEAEIDLNENWTLLLGGRYDTEDSSRSEIEIISTDPFVPFFPSTNTNFAGDASFDAFLPKAGLTYNFTPDASLALVAQRAYRPGGADIDPATGQALEFDPEFLWNYELALRIASADNRLIFNANLFYSDYQDMQIRFSPDPAFPTIRFIDNVGSAELYGLEIEALFKATNDLSLYASMGLIESEFNEFAFQGLDLSGNEFPFQPPISLAFGGTYEDERGISATVDFNYSDNFFSQVQNGPELRADDRLFVNTRLGYRGDNFGVFVYAQNLFDADFQTSVFRDPDPAFANAELGQPQTFGVILETEF